MAAIEVIIPHFSRWDLLARLLRSLEDQSVRPAVCVVDNGSTDSTLSELERFPDVRVYRSPRNLGFGRAVNAGVRSSTAEYIITLNNDMEAQSEFVASMLHHLQSGPGLAVGAMQLRPDGKIDSVGVAVDQSLCAYDVGHGLAPEDLGLEMLNAIGPSGGAAGYRRDTFLELDGYDERIFAYLEDVDLAIRMQTAAIQYRLASEARVWHRHSATLGSGTAQKNRLMGWSRGYILWKHRAQLNMSATARGLLIDGVIYAGQAVIDRNIGAVQGRIAFATSKPAIVRPATHITTDKLGISDALRRRLNRR
jgi:GT2 family glycosyltransferase